MSPHHQRFWLHVFFCSVIHWAEIPPLNLPHCIRQGCWNYDVCILDRKKKKEGKEPHQLFPFQRSFLEGLPTVSICILLIIWATYGQGSLEVLSSCWIYGLQERKRKWNQVGNSLFLLHIRRKVYNFYIWSRHAINDSAFNCVRISNIRAWDGHGDVFTWHFCCNLLWNLAIGTDIIMIKKTNFFLFHSFFS